ncbi:hypothetical protein J437_LFUL016707 [Ladona fulva]|uniref:Uncharacterized protein n=1 Tax=Ladona fulva TaxID=123851 RepID=A0A8K0P5R6_LADFU|nr:hypothetical protein J437_LFUL016707 [Ladona fulva]
MQRSIEDFLEKFSNSLEKLLKNSLIAREQSSYLKYKKENLQPSECLQELCCFVSESLKHDTIAAHLFQHKLISFPKKEVGEISKIV